MDPLSVIGAGAGAASALAGLFGGNDAQTLQAALAQRQLNQQYLLAQQAQQLATAGTRTARGDSVRYVPGIGWIESLSPVSTNLQGASDAESMARMTQDMPRARAGRAMNYSRRLDENSAANTMLNEFRNTTGPTRAGVEAALTEQNLARVDDGVRNTRSAVNMQALRSGSGASRIIDSLAARGRSGVRSAIADARVAAPGVFNELNNDAKGNALNRYNLMATRASNIDDVPFEPSNVADALSMRADRARLGAPGALGTASNAVNAGTGLSINTLGNQRNNLPLIIGGLGSAAQNAWTGLFDTKRQRGTTYNEPQAPGSTWSPSPLW